MQLSIRQITNKLNKHFSLFGLTLTVIVLAWTYYCVYDLWHGIKFDLCKPDNQNELSWRCATCLCSTWNDLANALTYILIGVILFFVVLNPLTYQPSKSIVRAIILFPIFLTFVIIAMFGTWHAGYVNGVHFGWWFIMTLIDTTLIIIGLILRWQRKHST